MSLTTQNPATLEILDSYSYMSPAEVERRISLAHAQGKIRNISVIASLAGALREHKQELAKQASLEMGKPLSEALAEVEKCALCCEYYFTNSEIFLREQSIFAKNKVVFDPLGALLAIMPWNFPYWQVIRFAAPALAAGNTVLLKHADLVAGCAEKLEQVFIQATQGKPLLQNLRIDHQQTSELIKDPRIRAVTFTGSARGGAQVASVAGAALKKTVLELGGSDAYIILADADLSLAARACAQARLINNGQSCVAAKRFIVEKSVSAEFIGLLQQEMRQFSVGSPLSKNTQRGPLAALRFKVALQKQIDNLTQQGAQVIHKEVGSLFSQGAYFPAHILAVDDSNQSSFYEELFGPVALVYTANDSAHALRIANKSIFGLGGAIFSRNIDQAQSLARQMECGFVAINDFVRSDPRLPFGGVKDSGYGRELGPFGIMEFVNIKTITQP